MAMTVPHVALTSVPRTVGRRRTDTGSSEDADRREIVLKVLHRPLLHEFDEYLLHERVCSARVLQVAFEMIIVRDDGCATAHGSPLGLGCSNATLNRSAS